MKIKSIVCKTTISLVVIFSFAILPVLATPNGAKYIPLDSWLYEGLDALYQESSKVVPFTTRPYTFDEYRYYLKNIDNHNLSTSGINTYKSIEKELSVNLIYEEENSAFSFNAIISPELFINSNKAIIEDNANQHYLNKYAYGYTDRVPFLSVPIQFWGGNSFFSEVDIDIKEQPGVGLYPLNSYSDSSPYVNWGNIPLAFDQINHHFPDSYYMSYSKPHLSLYIGSGELSIGTGRTGNLILSKDADKLSAIRLSWYNKIFKYNFSYISLNPGLGNSGKYADEGNVSMSLDLKTLTNGYTSSIYGTNFDDYMDTGLYPYKGYLVHSMEFRFLNEKVYAAVTEAAVYSRAVPELFTFSPLAFWHNGNNGNQTNSLLSLDLQVAIGKYGYIYASGVMDQFTMSHEDDTTEPEANGFIVGAISKTPVGKGYAIGGIEYVYTNDWLYTHKYWLQTPTVTKRNTAVTRGGYNVRMLGYSQGNDYKQIHVELGYVEYGHYAINASYNYGIKGPYDVFMRLPQKSGNTIIDPQGDRANWPDAIHQQVGLVGEYQLKDALTFGLQFYYTNVKNYKHEANNMQNVEISLGVRIDLGAL